MENGPEHQNPLKWTLRQQSQQARRNLLHRDEFSRKICGHVVELFEDLQPKSIGFYLSVRTEVQTHDLLRSLMAGPWTILVPWCENDNLKLFRLDDWGELSAGAFGILEPTAELREHPGKEFPPEKLDAILVPGVVFDRTGGRIGHGKGFYDKLLSRIPEQISKIGLAFECQVVEKVPQEEHDQPLTHLITEAGVFSC